MKQLTKIGQSEIANASVTRTTRSRNILEFLVAICLLIVTVASLSAQDSKRVSQNAQGTASVGQLYFYSIKDRPAFEEGYRRHLGWHAAHNDSLVWYAWTVDSGARKGTFVDGTFGATFAGLDARIDLSGDGADFVRNVTPYVTALNIETWTLWPMPSIATPLEDRHPGATLDVFLLQVDPAESASFEASVEKLAQTRRQSKREPTKLSWYRAARGNNLPTYMLLLTRKNWTDVEAAGPTFAEMLANAYAGTPLQVADVIRHAKAIRNETWDYEPRLSLIPGHSLEP
jgi:hypothetical protein